MFGGQDSDWFYSQIVVWTLNLNSYPRRWRKPCQQVRVEPVKPRARRWSPVFHNLTTGGKMVVFGGKGGAVYVGESDVWELHRPVNVIEQ